MYSVSDSGRSNDALSLLVVGQKLIGPGLRRLSLVGDERQEFACRPGQRFVLALPTEAGLLRRTGDVEAFDSEELRLDLAVPVADDARAARWLDMAKIGDRVSAALLAA
jgi:NADPH-dependent ferric siderophore reductase